MLSYNQALSIVLEAVAPLRSESIPLEQCLGRTLAEDAPCGSDLPPFDNSAMDGYAVRWGDIAGALPGSPVLLEVIDSLPAGRTSPLELQHGQAIRIMTGAALPRGAESVVAVEDTERAGDRVAILRPVKKGSNIRLKGEDVREGEIALRKGIPLRPSEMGLLASLGRAQIQVSYRPRVCVISTGDELIDPSEILTPGKIHDSNSYALSAMAERYGGQVQTIRRVKDTTQALEQALAQARTADLIITSGGVSVGDYDVVKEVLGTLGEIKFWQVAIKPGKPTVFGRIDDSLLFGLPGNPVSGLVIFELLVRPAMLRMLGRSALDKVEIKAKINSTIRIRSGRTECVRAWTAKDPEGEYIAHVTGEQGAGRLSSMAYANSLVIIPDDMEAVQAGDQVVVRMLDYPEV